MSEPIDLRHVHISDPDKPPSTWAIIQWEIVIPVSLAAAIVVAILILGTR